MQKKFFSLREIIQGCRGGLPRLKKRQIQKNYKTAENNFLESVFDSTLSCSKIDTIQVYSSRQDLNEDLNEDLNGDLDKDLDED